MSHRFLVALALLLLAVPCAAQRLDEIAVGTRVRLTTVGLAKPWTGTVVRRSADSLIVARESGQQLAVATGDITRLERSLGRSRGKGAARGALVGAALGGVAAYLSSGSGSGGSSAGDENAVFGAALGAAVGGAIGMLWGGERWERVGIGRRSG